MRIVLLSPNFRDFEVMKTPGRIAAYLNKLGNEVEILTCTNISNKYIDKFEDVKVVKVGTIFSADFIYIIQPSFLFYVLQNCKHIDCMITYGSTINNVLASIIYKYFNPKGVFCFKLDSDGRLYHGNSMVRLLKKLAGYFHFRLLSKYTDLITIESPEAMDRITKIHPFLNKKIIVLPNGVDQEYLDRMASSFKHVQKDNTILYVGRIEKGKGVDLLLNAFLKLKNKYPEWKLELVGKVVPNFKHELERIIELNSMDNVIMYGFLENEQLVERYIKSKIFCFPSRGLHALGPESFGLVLVEAGYFNNAIISSNMGAAEYVLDYGKSGLIFENENIEELTEKLECVIADDNLRYKLAANINNRCLEIFTWEKIVSNLNNRLFEIKKVKNH